MRTDIRITDYNRFMNHVEMRKLPKVFLLIIITSFSFLPFCQSQTVVIIDFYGRGYDRSAANHCITFKVGDTIPVTDNEAAFKEFKTHLGRCLAELPGIKQLETSFICCGETDNSWIAYIGLDTSAATASTKKYTAN